MVGKTFLALGNLTNSPAAITAVRTGEAAMVGYLFYKGVVRLSTSECGGCGLLFTP